MLVCWLTASVALRLPAQACCRRAATATFVLATMNPQHAYARFSEEAIQAAQSAGISMAEKRAPSSDAPAALNPAEAQCKGSDAAPCALANMGKGSL